MKRRISIFLLAISIICAIPISASAIKLRIPHNNISLYFSSGNVVCSASCVGRSPTDELDATLTLYENNSYVDSWSESGTWYVSIGDEYVNAVHGKTYKLTLSWYINGISQPSMSEEAYYS